MLCVCVCVCVRVRVCVCSSIRDAQGRLVDQVFGVRPKKRNSTGSVAVTNVRHHQESKVGIAMTSTTASMGVVLLA